MYISMLHVPGCILRTEFTLVSVVSRRTFTLSVSVTFPTILTVELTDGPAICNMNYITINEYKCTVQTKYKVRLLSEFMFMILDLIQQRTWYTRQHDHPTWILL